MREHGEHLGRIVYALGKLCPVGPKDLPEGVDVCRVLLARGIHSTLGRFSRRGDDPERIVRECRMASDALRAAPSGDRFYLSVKPPALLFDPERAVIVASTALQNGHGIHFDSHDHALADPTIRLLEQVMDRCVYPDRREGRWRFGLTLPARWKRSIADAEWIAGRGVRARLTKGEFRCAVPSEERDPAKGFLDLVDRLAGNVPEIALATHDPALAREAVARCRGTGSRVQLELLFGMPVGRMIALSRDAGVPVRFYVPYGDTLLVYGIRRFLTNPRQFLRPGFLEIFGSHRRKLARIAESL
jgi:proline dehydrogenase